MILPRPVTQIGADNDVTITVWISSVPQAHGKLPPTLVIPVPTRPFRQLPRGADFLRSFVARRHRSRRDANEIGGVIRAASPLPAGHLRIGAEGTGAHDAALRIRGGLVFG